MDKAKESEGQYRAAVEAVNKKLEERAQSDYIKKAVSEFNRLKTAYKEYLEAYKNGDVAGMNHWEEEAVKAREALQAITDNTAVLKLNAEAEDKLRHIAGDATAADEKHAVAKQKLIDKMEDQSAKAKEAERQTKQMVDQIERWLATMVLMRGLQSMWREAIKYATNYYDAMNEIRIVTMQTEEESLQ